jgi:hypothetical protein
MSVCVCVCVCVCLCVCVHVYKYVYVCMCVLSMYVYLSKICSYMLYGNEGATRNIYARQCAHVCVCVCTQNTHTNCVIVCVHKTHTKIMQHAQKKIPSYAPLSEKPLTEFAVARDCAAAAARITLAAAFPCTLTTLVLLLVKELRAVGDNSDPKLTHMRLQDVRGDACPPGGAFMNMLLARWTPSEI